MNNIFMVCLNEAQTLKHVLKNHFELPQSKIEPKVSESQSGHTLITDVFSEVFILNKNLLYLWFNVPAV